MSIGKTICPLPLVEIGIVVAVSILVFIGELALAEVLPWGSEARGVLAVFAGMAACLVLTVMRGGKPADLGFRRPKRWWTVPLWVLGILVTFVVAQNIVPLLVGAFLDLPRPDMSRYDSIRGNAVAALAYALILPLAAAVPEEILYRGFLLERLSTLFDGIWGAAVWAVLIQAVLFGLVHFQWGPGGILVTSIMGAVWGFAYLLCGRNLWIVIAAHSTAHLLLVAQIYTAPAG